MHALLVAPRSCNCRPTKRTGRGGREQRHQTRSHAHSEHMQPDSCSPCRHVSCALGAHAARLVQRLLRARRTRAARLVHERVMRERARSARTASVMHRAVATAAASSMLCVSGGPVRKGEGSDSSGAHDGASIERSLDHRCTRGTSIDGRPQNRKHEALHQEREEIKMQEYKNVQKSTRNA